MKKISYSLYSKWAIDFDRKISYHVDMNFDIQCSILFALISIDRFRNFLFNDFKRRFVH